ncbi:MAG: hypothetical protein CVU86_07160 [Firmicutes bacterium HGW-Firmicutes-11]|nr:MAG: hypothetical protein CVU86_07160 [Firmicutes bacterium HGW-Firmicutes-11]
MKNRCQWPNRMLAFFLSLILVCLSAGLGDYVAASEPMPVEKTFSQMTTEEKQRVLSGFLADGTAAAFLSLGGGTYFLNEALWMERGIIAYGNTAAVNAAVQTTGSSNFKDGMYRYWGYDINGGLYGNDNFPRDSDSGTLPWNKAWLTTDEIRVHTTARNYVGDFAINAGFSSDAKQATAEEFLRQNPQWIGAGHTVEYMVSHFYFNAVVSDSGLTQGQFVGVHQSVYDGRLYYQTFSLSVAYRTYVIPPPLPLEEEPADPPPPPEPSVGAVCSLGLPSWTFEGHPAPAEDLSSYLVEGETWSARRTMEAGLSDNRFSLPDPSAGRIRRMTPILAEAVFDRPGTALVQLSILPSGGSTLSDLKSIEVRPTPSISHTLTGVQKENRRQDLNLQIATHPEHPLTDFSVQILQLETEESVTLYHRMGDGENALDNSATIKTRPIEGLPSDSFFQNAKLSFLTKNTEPTEYRYIVTVKDDRGNADQVEVPFFVAPDLPPSPQILMESFFLRDKGSDFAVITARDGTVTDGDQLVRNWSLVDGDGTIALPSLPNFFDHSFGTRRVVGFSRFGVGEFRLRLEVTDHWTEETLDEYVTSEDRKKRSVEGVGDVINVAPVVRLTPVERTTAETLLLAVGASAWERLNANRSLINRSLIEEGIDADIRVVRLFPEEEIAETLPARATMEVATPFGYNGGSTFYENQNFLVDDHRLFKIDATWTGATQEHWPMSPYTVKAYEADTGHLLWSFSFGPDLFSVPNSGTYLAQDDQGTYLFVVAGEKTLVLDKDTGAQLTVLSFAVGSEVYVEGERIYGLKPDGLYRVSTETGHVQRIYQGAVSGTSRRVGGRVHFLAVDGLALFRGIFDPVKETLTMRTLSGSGSDDGRTQYRLAGIDAEGTMMITGLCPTAGGYYHNVRFYDRDGTLLFHTGFSGTSAWTYTLTPIYDEGGISNYFVVTWDSRSSSTYRVTAKVYGIRDSYVGEASVTDANGYPTESRQVIFAREIGGKPYVATGAYWTYILYTGSYGNGPTHGYPERTKVFVFDPKNRTAGLGNVNDLGLGIVTREYGRSSDTLTAVQTGNNHVGLTYGNETVVTAWNQTPETVMQRTLSKYYSGEADRNPVILLDETADGRFSQDSFSEEWKAILSKKNGDFFSVDSQRIETQGENSLGDLLVEEGSGKRNVLAVSVESQEGGSIGRSVSLDPNTTYYYEYEIKTEAEEPEHLLQMEHAVAATLPEDTFLPGGLTVTDSFYEDFNDGELSTFFRLNRARVSDGWYKGGNVYNQQGSNWSNRYFQDISTLSFTVPEGAQAALSFDWNIHMDGEQMWTANFIEVNGREWQILTPSSGSGRYTHPQLLPPGETTLTFYARAYGGRITEAKTWIDDLRVDLVEPASGGGVGSPGQWEASVPVSTGHFDSRSGYRKVTGSFQTPTPVTCYRPQAGVQILGGSVGVTPYTRWTSTNAGRKAFTFEVPAGKTSVYTLVSTASSPRIYSGNYYGSTYTYGGHSWTCMPGDRYPQSAMNNIRSNYRIQIPYISGTATFQQNSAAYRGAYGDFSRVDAVIVDDVNSVNSAGRFVIHDDQLLLEAEVFQNRGELRFSLPEGDHLLRNIAIYSLKNGVKVYALNDPLTDSNRAEDWQTENASAAILRTEEPETDSPSMVYQKGELVSFAIHYSDHEGDPSKKQYFRYTHTPYNDGSHPEAAVVLGEDGEPETIRNIVLEEPITRFFIDGKYTMEHWQVDNTSRPVTAEGNPIYDKSSNLETVTFYIIGTASAPWIESIKTIPGSVTEGQRYDLAIRVDDKEKDTLRLRTELYREGTIIYGATTNEIEAGSDGRYPEILLDDLPLPLPGIYDVVCTVRDDTGVGLGSYRFSVVSIGKIDGAVTHTDQWDENRKRYNLLRFSEEGNRVMSLTEYRGQPLPRLRGSNVFWSGERFLLSADVAGDPLSVEATIPSAGYRTLLTDTGRRNSEGERIFEGSLWDASMQRRWGQREPGEVVFTFTAEYRGGTSVSSEAAVIVDNSTDHWQLHRLW